MPLINGQKMACAPCIRGHRSTSCKHAHERLMVPVRKPGRPLSQCPHPPGAACSCGGGGRVTAALPRKKQCPCGPSPTEPDAPPLASGESLSPASPPSPTKGAYRVQKPGPGTRAAGRTQSLGAALERIDPNSLQVVNGYPSTATNGLAVGIDGLVAPGQCVAVNAGFMQQLPGYEDLAVFAPGHQPVGPPGQALVGVVTIKQETQDAPATNGHAPARTMPIVAPAVKSCCGGPEPATNGSEGTTPSVDSSEPDGQKKQGGSCCSPKVEAPNPPPSPLPAGMEAGHGPAMNGHPSDGLLMAEFEPPVALNPVYPDFMQQTVYTYPAPYGSFQAPLQPSHWPATMSVTAFGQPVVQGPPPVSMLYPAPYMVVDGIPNDVDTSHVCTCGDACNCLGCPAHPYNERTQLYVRTAWESQAAAATSSSSSSAATSRHPTEPASPPPAGTNGHAHPSLNGGHVAAPPPPPPPPPPLQDSPGATSDTASGNGEEQTLSASDFFFVDYTGFGGECGGDTATCPCGNNCACLGCIIHSQKAVAE